MEFIVPTLLVSISIAVAILVWFSTKRLILKLGLSKLVQDSILAVVKGPISAAIIGIGSVQALEFVDITFPDLIPFLLGPANLLVIVQLVILALALQVSVAYARRLIPMITGKPRIGGVLYVAFYAIGFVALSQILLASPLAPRLAGSIYAGINFLTGLLVTYLVVYILDIIMTRLIHVHVVTQPRLQTIYSFVRRLVLAGAVLTGVSATTFIVFPAAGLAISSLFIAAGFASIVIGLAAQSSISNIIAGMLITVSQPFKIGEAVMFRNEFCFVEDLKLVHTVLRTWDNRRLMVPNALLMSDIVINYTAEDPTMLVPVFVQISHESDLDKAMSIMREAALKHPECIPIGNLPNVVVMELAESGINLRLLSRAKDQPTAFMMARDLLYAIKKEFDANGIVIPYPRRYILLDKDTAKVLGRLRRDREQKS